MNRRGQLGAASLLGAFALACCQPGPPSRPATPTQAPLPPSSTVPPAAASATTTASSNATATESAAPPVSAAPMASAAPTKPSVPVAPEPEKLLPGHFSCGSFGQCRKGETCCPHDERCVPRGQEPPDCSVRSECDTSDECASGATCCANAELLSPPYYYRRCQTKICRDAEACREGTCPPGQRCDWLDPDDPRSIGRCANAKSRIACGDVVCEGDLPYCRWDPDQKKGSCQPAVVNNISDYQCDDDADCRRGERCWLNQSGSSCCRGDACFDHAVHSRYVACERASDCPSRMTFTCEPEEGLPPWATKRCFPHPKK